MCDCQTLTLFCKKIFNWKNALYRYTMIVLGIILLVFAVYFAIFGYGCLWSQYIGPKLSFQGFSPCVPFDNSYFFYKFFVGMIGLVMTVSPIVIGGLVIFGLGYGLYLLIFNCTKCCKKSYEEAKNEAQGYRITETTQLMHVNVTS